MVLDRPHACVAQRVHVALELLARVLAHDDDDLARTAVEEAVDRAIEERLAADVGEELPSAEPLGGSGGGDDRDDAQRGSHVSTQASRRERRARSVNPRAARLRWLIVPEVLSIGRAALCAAS